MPFPSSLRPALLALALAAPWAAASAQPATPTVAPVLPARFSVQNVAVLAGTCANCHGPQGRSTGGIPTLRGQDASHLLQRMQAFKANRAADATIMNRLMQGYDESQIQALAAWFSQEVQP